MPITEQQLLRIYPNAGPRAGVFVPALNAALGCLGITSPDLSGLHLPDGFEHVCLELLNLSVNSHG